MNTKHQTNDITKNKQTNKKRNREQCKKTGSVALLFSIQVHTHEAWSGDGGLYIYIYTY
jgi:hypothetical protein